MESNPILPSTLIHCKLKHFHTFFKGMTVYKQGEIAQEFYFIKEGLIGLYHTLDNGKESLVRLYQKGDYFGYRTLFGDTMYHCSAKVLVEAEIICIKPEDTQLFLLQNPTISRFLLQIIASELRDAEQRLAKSAYMKTVDRILDSVHFLSEHFPYYNWTHREIAEYSGCETETAIRISKELKKNGLLLPSHKDK
ncbi:CRP-like cAMP-binding protein [Bisgaardia hudsonensis]|uniref:CRP-like cAMP-binding protein n=1 Tax=Bisgaardia hudsonensis TaxID=109472 RepID=A0A4R2N2B3_9PAST|nr:Crp/Fnr family transcriptional regulator [Bisgaardia hudsonensis]QLB12459.1 cyclic nucleotide-binding protein [Bisgaardia hudsonensis]TCP13996.1 CRP-like cAMP-binding protein [Bisgaardia hudsonensis]